MWITKGAVLIRGRRFFEARRLLEEYFRLLVSELNKQRVMLLSLYGLMVSFCPASIASFNRERNPSFHYLS